MLNRFFGFSINLLNFLTFLALFGQTEAFLFFRNVSAKNANLAAANYRNSPIEYFVAYNWGDQIPVMRDELIRRKQVGQGFLQRHFQAWKQPANWRVPPESQQLATDPFGVFLNKNWALIQAINFSKENLTHRNNIIS